MWFLLVSYEQHMFMDFLFCILALFNAVAIKYAVGLIIRLRTIVSCMQLCCHYYGIQKHWEHKRLENERCGFVWLCFKQKGWWGWTTLRKYKELRFAVSADTNDYSEQHACRMLSLHGNDRTFQCPCSLWCGESTAHGGQAKTRIASHTLLFPIYSSLSELLSSQWAALGLRLKW